MSLIRIELDKVSNWKYYLSDYIDNQIFFLHGKKSPLSYRKSANILPHADNAVDVIPSFRGVSCYFDTIGLLVGAIGTCTS